MIKCLARLLKIYDRLKELNKIRPVASSQPETLTLKQQQSIQNINKRLSGLSPENVEQVWKNFWETDPTGSALYYYNPPS